MPKYIDAKNHWWIIDIDVSTLKRVRSMTDVDLLSAADGELIDRLHRDPILLCDVLYSVCAPEAKSAGISEDQFAAGLAGNAISDATAALIEALVEFFPEPQRRLLGQAAEKYQVMKGKALQLVETHLNDPAHEARALDQLRRQLEAASSGG